MWSGRREVSERRRIMDVSYSGSHVSLCTDNWMAFMTVWVMNRVAFRASLRIPDVRSLTTFALYVTVHRIPFVILKRWRDHLRLPFVILHTKTSPQRLERQAPSEFKIWHGNVSLHNKPANTKKQATFSAFAFITFPSIIRHCICREKTSELEKDRTFPTLFLTNGVGESPKSPKFFFASRQPLRNMQKKTSDVGKVGKVRQCLSTTHSNHQLGKFESVAKLMSHTDSNQFNLRIWLLKK